MRDGYPLEAVLSLRRLERDERSQDLRSARAKVRECRLEIDEARMSEDRARNQLDAARRKKRLSELGGTRAADIQAHVRHMQVLERQLGEAGRRIEAARDAAGRAARALEGARERLALALAELRAVERHRDAWVEETRRERERRAEEDP